MSRTPPHGRVSAAVKDGTSFGGTTPEGVVHLASTCEQPLPSIPDHQLLRMIGRGSYGEVWIARSVTGSLRAVKLIYRKSFDQDRPYDREFDGLKKFEPLSHARESQVDIFHVGRNDDAKFFYYIMELADNASVAAGVRRLTSSESEIRNPKSELSSEPPDVGSYVARTLKHDLHTRGALSVAECVQIALSLTGALEHLHAHGLVHRDIKPSNIIFVNGVPKLADIGLVASVDATRSFVGTDGYIPPEGPGAPAGDIYSLGKVLYELVTAKDRLEFPELPADWRTRSDFDQLLEFNEILTKACDADPRQRCQSVDEMRAELELLRTGQSVKRERAFGRGWKLARIIAVAAMVLALVSVGAIFALRELDRNRLLSSEPEAQKLYDQAVYLLHSSTLEQQLQAFAKLTNAVKLDPQFVDAYYKMFETFARVPSGEFPSHTDQMANFKWVADKIRALRPDSAQYHTVNSLIKFYDWHFDAAIEEVRLALKLDRKLLRAHLLYGWYMLLARTDVATARAEFQAAERIDGSDMITQVHLGDPYYFERNFPRAIEQYQKALGVESRQRHPHLFLGYAYAAQRQYDEALEEFEKAEKMQYSNIAETEATYTRFRSALAEKGPRGMWQAMLDEMRQSPSSDPHDMATLCARLGNADEVFELLAKAYQQHSGGMVWIQLEDWWDPLRNDTRYKELLKKMGFAKVMPPPK